MNKRLVSIFFLTTLCFGNVCAQEQIDSAQWFLDKYNIQLLSWFQKQQSTSQLYTLDSQLNIICDSLIQSSLSGWSTWFWWDYWFIQPRSSIYLLYLCRRANPKWSVQYFSKSFPMIDFLDQKEITKDLIEKATDKPTFEKVKSCFDTDLQRRYQSCPIIDFMSVILRIVQWQQQLSLFTANLWWDWTIKTTQNTMKNYSPQRFFFKTFHTFPLQLDWIYQKWYEGKNVQKKQIVSERIKQQISSSCWWGLNPFSTDKSYRWDKISTVCAAPDSLSDYQQYLSQLNTNRNKKNVIYSTKIFDEWCFDAILSGQTNLFQCACELWDPRLESNVLLNEYMTYKLVVWSLWWLYWAKQDTISQVTPCALYSDIQWPSTSDKLNWYKSCYSSYDWIAKKSLKQSTDFYFQQKNAVIAQYFISVITEKIQFFNNNYFYKLMVKLRKLLNQVWQPKWPNVYNKSLPK